MQKPPFDVDDGEGDRAGATEKLNRILGNSLGIERVPSTNLCYEWVKQDRKL